MSAVPAETAETTPEAEPIVAFEEPEIHVPPPVAQASGVDAPSHTGTRPEIAAGAGLIDTTRVAGLDAAPPPEDTTQLYVPALAGVIDGNVIVAPVNVKPAGPDQVNTGLGAAELAVSVIVSPGQ
jgi:hypothetical protein